MYNIALIVMLALAIISFVYLQFITAPYGRHAKQNWGPNIANHWGWVLMESPAVLFFIVIYAMGTNALEIVPFVLLCLWQFHYIYRTFIFPFRLRSKTKKMPLAVCLSGFGFNCFNAFLNAYWIANLGNYSAEWLVSAKFILGCFIFFSGFYIHYHSDVMLMNLRKPGETGYKIPQGFLFRWFVSPNYLGEVIMWTGFTIASWSPAALVFTVFTIANLLPRSISHKRWYREKFPDFPKHRI